MILWEILEALKEQNPENWAAVRVELVEIIGEEVGGGKGQARAAGWGHRHQ